MPTEEPSAASQADKRECGHRIESEADSIEVEAAANENAKYILSQSVDDLPTYKH